MRWVLCSLFLLGLAVAAWAAYPLCTNTGSGSSATTNPDQFMQCNGTTNQPRWTGAQDRWARAVMQETFYGAL